MSKRFDFCIVGGGVIGAAVAYKIRDKGKVCILEKNEAPFQEASRNNSGVTHPGFNHPPDSFKGRLCVEGNRLLYEYCAAHDVPTNMCGTFVLALTREDAAAIARLRENAARLGVELQNRMPEHRRPDAVDAVFAPRGGIVDAAAYCASLLSESAAQLFTGHRVTAIRWEKAGWEVDTSQGNFSCDFLLNAAGLSSDEIAALAGYSDQRIYPCSGEYYEIQGWSSPHLYYPAPAGGPGLGVHLVPTFRNTTLIGPTATYLASKTDPTRFHSESEFREAAERLYPGCTSHPVRIGQRGVRPKLSAQGFHDYVIRRETDKPMIQLIGIESPGLTASLSIAEYVRQLI
ncbi:MAG TPA: FAD-dependent oxidoreductase [Acidobacteriota bacterium]|nr:FAD-dependent oxidoreductase [Acidobacteriota bacterium]